MKTKQLSYDSEYIPVHLINQCFIKEQITHVDKTLCGNGFTYGYLSEIDEFGIKVLILPNVSTVKSKEKQNENRQIQFFYGGVSSSIKQSTKIIVTTTDTFKNVLSEKLKKGNLVHKILIDEFHTVVASSTYRPVLKRFLQFVKLNFSKSAIVTVTATPILGQPLDIVIKPITIKPTIIELNPHFEQVLSEVKQRISKNEPTIIFSNSTVVGKQISNTTKKQLKTLDIKLISGDSYLHSMTKNAKFEKPHENSYLITSAGFEGHDLLEKDAHVYILQDLNNYHEHFTLKNIFQAMHRTRNGAQKITYSRIETNNDYPNVSNLIAVTLKRIHKYIGTNESNAITTTRLNKSGYTMLEQTIIKNCFRIVDNGKGNTTVSTMPEMIAYYKEIEDWVNNGVHSKSLESFIEQRKIIFMNATTTQKKVPNLFAKRTEVYARYNHEIIKERQLDNIPFKFNRVYAKRYNRHIVTEFTRQLENFLAYQRHDPEYRPSTVINNILRIIESSNKGTYTTWNKLIKMIISDYSAKKNIEYRNEKRVKDIAPAVQLYKEQIEYKVIELFSTLLNYNIKFREDPEMGEHRVYNQLTGNSIITIKTVCELLGIRVQELDIASCNPRIIYSKVGLELPTNFYGVNKVNKRKINILLNSFSYAKYVETCKANNIVPMEVKYHKRNKINEFIDLGFDSKVIEWLFMEFYNEPKEALYIFCTYQEKLIVNELTRQLLAQGFKAYRRHDSVMLFNQKCDIDFSNFEFNGVKGWFNEWNILNDTPCYITKYSEFHNGYNPPITDEHDANMNTCDDDESEFDEYNEEHEIIEAF